MSEEGGVVGVKSDERLQGDVIAALRRNSEVQAARVGVSAIDGAVTLSGEVASDAERFAATETVKRVAGVIVVADELRVHPTTNHDRTDTDIAVDVAHAIGGLAEREFAERAVSDMPGVRSVKNRVHVHT